MTAAALLSLALPAVVLTLAEAVRTAEANHPQLRLARANTDAAWARSAEARSALVPQLSGTASYQRTTNNFSPRPGLLPSQVNGSRAAPPSFATANYFTFGLTLSQYVWDFRAPFAFGATRASAEAQRTGERTVAQQVRLNVRSAYLLVRAQDALAQVAHHNLSDQARHLAQSRAFVEQGARPDLDVAQSETNLANAQVQAINADNAVEVAKVLLNQAMGVERGTRYDVDDEVLAAVDGEDDPLPRLTAEALRARPDLASLELQAHAQALTVAAAKGGYGPSFAGAVALTDVGPSLGNLVWNWSATVSASWNLFDGLLTVAQVREARAGLHGLEAQRDSVRQQVLVDVTQAQLQVRAAKATLAAADQALVSGRLQLALAEGRYQEGIGNLIDLSDAQLAFTSAAAQRVQAEYNLSVARAQLLRALGRP